MSQANEIYIKQQLEKYSAEVERYKKWGEKTERAFHVRSSAHEEGTFEALPELPNVAAFLTAARTDLRKYSESYQNNFGIDDDESNNGHLQTLFQRARNYMDGVGAESKSRSSEGRFIVEETTLTLQGLSEERDALLQASNENKTKFDFANLQKVVDTNTNVRKKSIQLLNEVFNPTPESNSKLVKEQLGFDEILAFPRGQVTDSIRIKNIPIGVLARSKQLPTTQGFYYQEQLKQQITNYNQIRLIMQQRFYDSYKRAMEMYDPAIEKSNQDSGTQNRYESVSQMINEVQSQMEFLLKRYDSDILALQKLLKDVELYRRDADVQEGVVVVAGQRNIVTIKDQPIVQIFELVPPPVIDVSQNFVRVQREVQQKFQMFEWPSEIRAAEENECSVSTLNQAQKLSYHYMHPYNQMGTNLGVNVMLVHSLGSGKTCTGQLITSVFARAGYTIMQVSKQTLKGDLPEAAVKNQCDFNVQQYTKGQTSVDAVINDQANAYMLTHLGADVQDVKKYIRDKLAGETPLAPKEKIAKKVKSAKEEDELSEYASLLGLPIGEVPEPTNVQEKEKEEEEEDPQKTKKIASAVKKYIFHHIFKEMGIVQITAQDSVDALAYSQFGRFSKPQGMQKYIQKFLFGRDQVHKPTSFLDSQTEIQREREKSGDILRKCFVIIDEVHKLVTNPSDLEESDKIDFEEFRKQIWRSYRMSGKDSVRVCLLTATPIAEHPLDLINLATLLASEEEVTKLGFNNYHQISKATKRSTENRFMKDHYDFEKGRFKDASKIQELLNGRISYFNYSGDASRFAQPSAEHMQDGKLCKKWTVTYVPVKLSMYQANMTIRCFPEQLAVSEKIGKFIEHGAQGFFTFNLQTGVLSIAQGVPTVPAAYKPHHLAQKDPTNKAAMKDIVKKKVDCLMHNAIWPIKNERSIPSLKKEGVPDILSAREVIAMSSKSLKDTFTDRVLRDYSPIMRELLQRVESRKNQGERELMKLYSPEIKEPLTKFSDRMTAYKQYIFTDNVSDIYGVNLIAKFLETLGYERINTGKDTAEITPAKRPYMGMMVFDKSVKSTSAIRGLLDTFNNSDNIDGKKCALFVNSGRFKEGISLRHIRFAHIMGIVLTHADLSQAVARAIRNCSRQGTPYIRGRGWTINIDIYSPSLPNKEDSLHPLEILQGVNPEMEIVNNAKKEMHEIMQAAAYDKLLLASINDASALNEQAVQMWQTNTIIQPKCGDAPLKVSKYLESKENVVPST
jgi:hypothetical protein